jgi:hypothetical protein
MLLALLLKLLSTALAGLARLKAIMVRLGTTVFLLGVEMMRGLLEHALSLT